MIKTKDNTFYTEEFSKNFGKMQEDFENTLLFGSSTTPYICKCCNKTMFNGSSVHDICGECIKEAVALYKIKSNFNFLK